jgi:hypothetical protein
MKLSPIILRLRAQETIFNNYIGGAAQLAQAMEFSLSGEAAFVIQLAETATANTYDNSINQKISERFAVVVALDNGTSDRDKTGLIAFDKLQDIRAQIFSAILGWQIPGTESIIEYSAGKVLGINRAWLWYQFEFSAETRITDEDGFDNKESDLGWFDTLYAQYVLMPSADMPVENLPVNIFDVDMTQIIDFTTNPAIDGGFSNGFGQVFDTYKP